MPATRRERISLGAAIVGATLLAFAVYIYLAYAREHLRRPPRVDSCFIFLQFTLADLPAVSGTERHEFEDGAVVFLREPEDKAVRCSFQHLGDAYAEKVARALAEIEPEPRAAAVAQLALAAPPGPSGDREAQIAYLVAHGALAGVPTSPSIAALSARVEEAHACRFTTDEPCASRPPLPWTVPALGVPGVAAILPGLALALAAALRRARLAAASKSIPPRKAD